MGLTKSPLIHNKRLNTHRPLIHAAGKADRLPLCPSVLNAAERWRIDAKPDPDLTIITFNNGGTLTQEHKWLGVFE